MNFSSDNSHGVAQPIMDAVIAANGGPVASYGGDEWTARVRSRMADVFEQDVEVFLVPSGTAANALSIAALTPPYGSVFAHAESHIQREECGACEFFSGGAKLIPVDGFAGRMAPDDLKGAIALYPDLRHDLIPSGMSLTEATDCGTLYRADDIAALAEIAHAAGIGVHIDGARFANAVAALGVAPADLTWRAGVDIMSFGATKNGAIAAEAVVVFDASRARDLAYRRKRAGHLLSKMRFVAAQFEAYLADGLWLDLAGHANAMAARLGSGLAAVPGIRLPWPVEANEVFPVMPRRLADALIGQGAVFYPWTDAGLAGTEHALREGETFFRLVTSFATTQTDVDAFITIASAEARGSPVGE